MDDLATTADVLPKKKPTALGLDAGTGGIPTALPGGIPGGEAAPVGPPPDQAGNLGATLDTMRAAGTDPTALNAVGNANGLGPADAFGFTPHTGLVPGTQDYDIAQGTITTPGAGYEAWTSGPAGQAFLQNEAKQMLGQAPAATPGTPAAPTAPTAPGAPPSAPPGAASLSLVPGGGSDTRPSIPNPPTPSPLGQVVSAGTGSGYASLSPTNAADDLRSKTILPGPQTDRFGIARNELANLEQQQQPYFTANLREANRAGWRGGQGGSGQLRTSLGNIVQTQDIARQTRGQSFLNNALTGSIEDAYRNLGQLNQQQQFQAGQQNQAFSQGLQQKQLEEALRSGDFNRYLQLLLAGSQGNPSGTALALSDIYGSKGNYAAGGK